MRETVRRFHEYIAREGLKNTPQRLRIVEVFYSLPGHHSVEELYARVRQVDTTVGQATVYRTMKLLCDAGLAREVRFDDGISRYEPRVGRAHHDHLICENCGRTLEVLDPQIERLQDILARQNGFVPTRHVLYLYGLCPDCQSADPPGAGGGGAVPDAPGVCPES